MVTVIHQPLPRFRKAPVLCAALAGIAWALFFVLPRSESARAGDDPTFTGKVAPIFAQRCVSCHHGDKPKGGLDLTTRQGLLTGGEHGPAIVPGKSGNSLLIKKMSGKKPDMPKGTPPLADAQVAEIAKWIDGGVAWPAGLVFKAERAKPSLDWWSLKPIIRPAVPKVKNAERVRNPLDAFVLARLEAAGLAPSPEADRATLIRRLTFDLHGLPPTPEEIDAFVKDKDPKAYEHLVDRLLKSPRYGERWGRHWLDVVHYGDTHGYDRDKRRPNAWPYRDYVIRSFNADKPYSRFVREQLAGDVLYPKEPDALIATGFIAAGPWDFEAHTELREGSVDRAKTLLLDRDDMVLNAMSTFTSLTIHCARCHDHKFDPIPQKDYYRLQAVFAGLDRQDRIVTDTAATKRAEIEVQRRARISALPAGWHSNFAPAPDTPKWVQVDLGKSLPIEEVRLIPAWPADMETAGYGFPRRFRVDISDDEKFEKFETILDHSLRDDFENPGARAVKIPGGGKKARFVRMTAVVLDRKTVEAFLFALAEIEVDSNGKNVAVGAPVTALDSLEDSRWSRKFLTDGFDGRKWLRLPADAALREKLEKTAEELEDLTRQRHALPAPQLVYAVASVPPRPIRLLNRGEVEQPREPVGPGAASCVQGLEFDFKLEKADEGKRRVALAEWIVDPKNPLTRRSIVNRVWQYHFGRGLVATPSDFGRNGQQPTHPELLDWLADEFGKQNESLKALHKLIVTSTTYRQASLSNPASARQDADNLLLWRMNRTRLDAESLRDAVLAVSGKLSLEMGGPGFELFQYKDDKSPVYDHLAVSRINDPKNWRRTVYRFTVRSVPNPFLECLDCPDPSVNTPVRNTTLTALQSLALLNDPFMIRQAECFAERLQKESNDPPQQITSAYRLAFGRAPSAKELEALTAYLKKYKLANACLLLFNANEFIFVD
jgi:mono/diheme cytochrome c family protein